MNENTENIEKMSFSDYLVLLSTQALYGLGGIPNPETGKPEINLPLAQHTIDIMGLIEEKTKGNLTPEETSMLSDSLTQLRMAFVEVAEDQGKKGIIV